ncbi:SCO family protein [Flavobacteriaceae bacterium 3-367]|uniref:SCO family protein n=1 Tax=Eudoraea algarum TaxID=3417568 RepID=UPI00328D5925
MHWKMKWCNGNGCFLVFIALWSLAACKDTKETEKLSRTAHLPYYRDASFSPHWLEKDSDTIRSFHRIPDFEFVNQLGDTITQETFGNKIYVADFFFTSCPGICPKMTANMSLLQKEFIADDGVLLLSHSVTPERDSVPVLKSYGANKGVDPNKWHLVTGERKQIYDLGRDAYFVEEDLGVPKDVNDFLHTENFVLIDTERHIRGIYNGLNKTAIAQLIADIKTLKSEN